MITNNALLTPLLVSLLIVATDYVNLVSHKQVDTCKVQNCTHVVHDCFCPIPIYCKRIHTIITYYPVRGNKLTTKTKVIRDHYSNHCEFDTSSSLINSTNSTDKNIVCYYDERDPINSLSTTYYELPICCLLVIICIYLIIYFINNLSTVHIIHFDDMDN